MVCAAIKRQVNWVHIGQLPSDPRLDKHTIFADIYIYIFSFMRVSGYHLRRFMPLDTESVV